MNSIIKLGLIIIALFIASGCASSMYQQNNSEYKNTKQFKPTMKL